MLSNLTSGMCGLAAYGDVASPHLAWNASAGGRVLSVPRERRTFALRSADLCRSVSERVYDPLI